MKVPIWLSYDLSVRGDYEGLYAWLDNHDAKECGDSIAFIMWDDNGIEEIPKQVQNSILNSFNYDKRKDRIYIIYQKEASGKISSSGKFILGTRKANPWQGFASGEEEVEDEVCFQ